MTAPQPVDARAAEVIAEARVAHDLEQWDPAGPRTAEVQIAALRAAGLYLVSEGEGVIGGQRVRLAQVTDDDIERSVRVNESASGLYPYLWDDDLFRAVPPS